MENLIKNSELFEILHFGFGVQDKNFKEISKINILKSFYHATLLSLIVSGGKNNDQMLKRRILLKTYIEESILVLNIPSKMAFKKYYE